MIQTTEEAPLADLLGSAVEKLDAGDVATAHRLLVQLIRTNSTDADVIFHLAVARRRLGYDVSAEALFGQAFDHGYAFPADQAPTPVADRPEHFVWADPSGEVRLLLRQRPRRSHLMFIGFNSDAESAA